MIAVHRYVWALALASLVVAEACVLTPYPSGAVSCADGEQCPDGYICANPLQLDAPRCYLVGCGDGLIDLTSEACDDANDNELDGCTKACEAVTLTANEAAAFGLGAGQGDARTTPLGRPTAIAADTVGGIALVAAQSNVLFRLTPVGDDGALSIARVGGNETMLGGVVVARSDRPDRMSVTFATSIAQDSFGNVFLGDLEDSVIRRLDGVTGLIDTVAGTGVSIGGDDDDQPGQIVPVNVPRGLVVDGVGALFFADRGPLNESRVRRLDPDTGRVRTVFASTADQALPSIDDLVIDGGGVLHAMTRRLILAERGGRRVHDNVVGVTALRDVGKPLLQAETLEVITNTTDAEDDEFISGPLPGVGNGQAAFTTVDGQTFFFVMSNSVVGIDFARRVGRSLATEQDVLDPDDADFLVDAEGEELPFSIKPTDLTVSRGALLVSDPGNSVVWRVPIPADLDAVLAPIDLVPEESAVAGTSDQQGTVGAAVLLDEIAVGFARESDGHVVSGATLDCGAETPLSGDALEFTIAFPDQHRVLFSNCDAAISILAGTGSAGFGGDDGRADLASLNRPTAFVRVDRRPRGENGGGLGLDDFFFIADRNNDRVRRVRNVVVGDRLALHIDTVLGGQIPAPEGVPLSRPSGLAIDDTGGLLVADAGNHRVLRYDPLTGAVVRVAGTGQAGTGPDGGTALETPLNEPVALVFLSFALVSTFLSPDQPPLPPHSGGGGLLLITERAGHRVRGVIFPAAPGDRTQVLTLAGDGTPGDADAAVGSDGSLTFPRSVMFGVPNLAENQINFYVVDAIDRLRVVSMTLSATSLFSASLGTLDGGRQSRLDGGRSEAAFRSPAAIAMLDAARALVVDRTSGRLRLINLAGDVETVLGTPEGAPITDSAVAVDLVEPCSEPAGVAVQSTASPPVAWISEAGAGRVTRVVMTDPASPSTWLVDRPALSVPLQRPEGVAVDGDALYVADAGAHVVVRYDVAGGVLGAGAVVAGVSGQRGVVGDGDVATAALLNGPQGVAVRDGVVVIADTGNNRVRRVDPVGAAAGTLRTILGDGSAANAGEGFFARSFPVRSPRGLAIDAAGNIYVTAGNTVRLIGAGNRSAAEEAAKLTTVGDADDSVTTLFGAAGRQGLFPETVMRCLDGIALPPAGTDASASPSPAVVVDGCAGIVVPLDRSLRTASSAQQ